MVDHFDSSLCKLSFRMRTAFTSLAPRRLWRLIELELFLPLAAGMRLVGVHYF